MSKFTFHAHGELILRHLDYPLNEGGSLLIGGMASNSDGWRLDLGSIEQGLNVMASHYPRYFADFMMNKTDGTTGNVFLQCCLFGKVIYA